MLKLERISHEPLLKPNLANSWEAGAVFNCAAVHKDGLVHLVYRATDISSNGSQGRYINNLGYAVSSDGINFNRLSQPILVNDIEQEDRGPEDPRIVKLGEIYHMMYTGFGGRFPGDYRISHATSKNLIQWKRQGIVLDEKNKDASLFPERINGEYLLLHRRPPDIWLSTSKDLQNWENHQILMRAKPESDWESEKIGIGGPPIKIAGGWLQIYHGVSISKRYSLGVALLDLEDPFKIITRQKEPILEPELEWEVNGHVPNVVFSCGQVEIGDDLVVYYGGADTVIGGAKIKKSDINFN